jgi:hypothetical protein
MSSLDIRNLMENIKMDIGTDRDSKKINKKIVIYFEMNFYLFDKLFHL